MRFLLIRTKQFLLLTAFSLVVFSCNKEDVDPIKEQEQQEQQEQKISQSELKIVLEADNLSGVVDNVLSEIYQVGKSGKTAKKNDCYEAEFTDTGFTVNFSNCDIEGTSEKVNGALTVVYAAKGDIYEFAVSFDNLMVGEIGLNGTRTFEIIVDAEGNPIGLNLTYNMSITMEDGSIVSEEGSKTIAIVLGEEFGDGTLTVDGEWTVKAEGNTYAVDVSQLLETNFDCDFIGKGVILLSKNELEVTVDFGDGDCDDIAAVTYPDGIEEEVRLKKYVKFYRLAIELGGKLK